MTFNKHRFQVTNAYDLDISVQDDYRISRTFRERFYSYKDLGYNLVLGIKFLEHKGAGYYD